MSIHFLFVLAVYVVPIALLAAIGTFFICAPARRVADTVVRNAAKYSTGS